MLRTWTHPAFASAVATRRIAAVTVRHMAAWSHEGSVPGGSSWDWRATARDGSRTRILRRMTSSLIPREPDGAEFPEPPGGGLALAVTGGLATAGAVFLIWAPLLVLVWIAVASILTGIVVRQGRHVFTITMAAVVLPLATSFLATCLTGMWGWLVVGVFVYALLLAVATPVGFAIGRLSAPA